MTVLLVGCGHPDRGDDAAGIAVAERVEAAGRPDVHIVTGTVDPATLMDLWDGVDEVVVVDASSSGLAPGTVRRIDPGREAVPARAAASSHELGPAEAIELAKALDRLPRSLLLYAIEAGSCDLGAPISPPVVAAVEQVAEELLDRLAPPPRSSRTGR